MKSIIITISMIAFSFSQYLYAWENGDKYNPITEEVWISLGNGEFYNSVKEEYLLNWENGSKYNPNTEEIWLDVGNGNLYNPIED